MENKKQKSMGKTVVIIILVVLLICSLGYTAYDKYLYKLLKKDNNVVEEKTTKEEKIDVNSRLVQNLYHKVSTGEMSKEDANCNFNYMYDTNTGEEYSTTDFYADKADEKQKMKILGRLLSSNEKKYYFGEESLIPEKISGGDHMSAYAYNSYANLQGTSSRNEYYYSKDYINRLYKELYGKTAKLDTTIPISPYVYEIELYSYVEEVDKYILYMLDGGGICGPEGLYATLTKATTKGNELRIYEKVTKVSTNDQGITTETDADNYIYTFKLEDDGMYSFYSRVKES